MASIFPKTVDVLRLKPGFVRYVRNQYEFNGYDVIPNVGIDLDANGLEWVRTFNLRDRKTLSEWRVIEPEDLLTVIVKADCKLNDMVRKEYGYPGACV